MSAEAARALEREAPDAAAGGSGAPPEDAVDVECPVCYQEYNHFHKCPRVLRCRHVFCTECLQRIQLVPSDPAASRGPPAIPCPLCRRLTPLGAGGDALSLPCSSRVLAGLPRLAFCLPGTVATVTQRVVLSLEADSRDAHFIILPTVSLRVQQMRPGGGSGLLGEGEGLRQSRKKLFYVQLLAVAFWVLFVITCVVGVVFSPHFFKKKF